MIAQVEATTSGNELLSYPTQTSKIQNGGLRGRRCVTRPVTRIGFHHTGFMESTIDLIASSNGSGVRPGMRCDGVDAKRLSEHSGF
jgi:hypothetical protein